MTSPHRVELPEFAMIVLAGISGSGKSALAHRHFAETEVLSLDRFRAWVSDGAPDLSSTADGFDVLKHLATKRLARRKLCVIDGPNVLRRDRASLVALARQYDAVPVIIVLNLAPPVCQARNAHRAHGPGPGKSLFGRTHVQLQESLHGLEEEGFRQIVVLDSPEAIDRLEIVRVPLSCDRRDLEGPFDIIGDVHGCYDELVGLLTQLGYTVTDGADGPRVQAPPGRTAVFLGDLIDRGPDTPGVLALVMAMVDDETALCVPGNHEIRLGRWLDGRGGTVSHGMAETLAQLDTRPPAFVEEVKRFLGRLASHYVLDGGWLVVAHAGMKASLCGRTSARAREFAAYGETAGETDEFGLPVRHDWANKYRGEAAVIYGHMPVPEVTWVNRTLCIDTGCVFGGALTALRWPEKELRSQRAARVYYAPVRSLGSAGHGDYRLTAAGREVLDIEDVLGPRAIETAYGRRVSIRTADTAAPLEVMSRFAVDPRWLIYLPPSMSPPRAGSQGDELEPLEEALEYYASAGQSEVLCEEKHRGARVIVVVCRDDAAAQRRFGIRDGSAGVVYTRTGCRVFSDADVERALLDRVRAAVDRAGLWRELATSWLCLDAELMSGSLRRDELIVTRHIPAGEVARVALDEVLGWIERAEHRGVDADDIAALRSRFNQRRQHVDAYRQVLARQHQDIGESYELRLAPFHLLASDGQLCVDRPHPWHVDTLARLVAPDDPLLLPTRSLRVDLSDVGSRDAAHRWCNALIDQGGEGLVVKPLEWVIRQRGRLLQPALKCRGREQLRVVYGPEYCDSHHLDRLRRRNLGARRTLVEREYALGLEALRRFVDGEPLHRVHECVFGVLVLESKPTDPRL